MNYLVTGLICSGKTTFLKIAEEHNFHAIRSDDIVSELYNDSSIIQQIKKHLDVKLFDGKLKDTIKEFFFKSKKNREIIEAIFHPTVHKMIIQKLSSNQNIMVELPPIINNYELFKSYDSIYIDAKENIRTERCDTRELDRNYFNEMNKIQDDYQLIKDVCDIVIDNNYDNIESLSQYFERGVIKT